MGSQLMAPEAVILGHLPRRCKTRAYSTPGKKAPEKDEGLLKIKSVQKNLPLRLNFKVRYHYKNKAVM